MLQKNFLLRDLNTLSIIALSGFLGFFATPCWSMEGDEESAKVPSRSLVQKVKNVEEFFRIEDFSPEVGQRIFSSLPLGSYEHVIATSRRFHDWSQDAQGPFKDLINFKNFYSAQIKKLLEHKPDIYLLSQTLIQMRNSLQILRHRPLEEQRKLAVQLFEAAQKSRVLQSRNLTYKSEDKTGYLKVIWQPLSWLKDKVLTPDIQGWLESEPKDKVSCLRLIWWPLAWIRACDKLLPPPMQKWFEETVLPRLKCLVFPQEALILLHEQQILSEGFILNARTLHNGRHASNTRVEQNPFTEELCERGHESIQTVLRVAREFGEAKGWQSAAKYYTIALEKDPTLPTTVYLDAAGSYFNLGDWKSAAKYSSIALEKDPGLPAEVYAVVGNMYCYLKKYEMAVKYFTIALERNSTLSARVYLNAGYSAAKVNQLERAKVCFEKFMTDQHDNTLEIKLLPDALNLIEDVLTTTKSDAPFREWINLKKIKILNLGVT